MCRRTSLKQKIMADVHVCGVTGCWTWLKGTSGDGRGGGYGRIYFDGGMYAVHRAMWIIEFGPIPHKKQIDHTCNNRLCCNPEHLELVTHKQNQRRRDERKKAA